MRTDMAKKYFCLIVVLLFLIPTVTALNGNNSKDSDENSSLKIENLKLIKEDTKGVFQRHKVGEIYCPDDKLSIEVADVLNKYSPGELDQEIMDYLVKFNVKMLERREKFMLENPDMPYIPFDITRAVGKYNPETGEQTSLFPGADIIHGPEPINYKELYENSNDIMFNSVNPGFSQSTTSEPTTSSSTRSARAAPEADLEVTQIEWTAVNEGWGNYFEIGIINSTTYPGNQYYEGGFQVGKTTKISATITNNGPTFTGITNVKVNFSIFESASGDPMMKRHTAVINTFSGVDQVVEYDFTPTYACLWMSINVIVDYAGDEENTNNGRGWNYIPVMIWSADFESGGTNYGWQKTAGGQTISSEFADWNGDTSSSPTADNLWHITNSPANRFSNDHTQSNAWYHGSDGTPDSYDDSPEHLKLETPVINMGDITDGQEVLGDLPEDSYYYPYIPMYSVLATGEVELTDETGITWQEALDTSDYVWLREYSDDNGALWWDSVNSRWRGFIIGDYSQFLTNINPGHLWNPLANTLSMGGQEIFIVVDTNDPGNHIIGYDSYHFPFGLFYADGNGGVKDLNQPQNWTQVQFRADFRGDNEGDEEGPGIYIDDFIAMGTQDFEVPYRVGLSDMTYPTSNINNEDVPILMKSKGTSFTTTVKNYGKSLQFNVKVSINKVGDSGPPVYEREKSSGVLPNDGEKEHSWTEWTPLEEGDYKLVVTVGDLDEEWTPGDNQYEILLHVSPAENVDSVDILLVDDDNSEGSRLVSTPTWYSINTEGRMMQALEDNDMKYRVYTVPYNDTGPIKKIMDDYEIIIWMTGLDNKFDSHAWRRAYRDDKNNPNWRITLKTQDITELTSYLDSESEKKLWLISPGFLYDYYGTDPETTGSGDFARKYLKIFTCQGNLTEYNDDDEITVQGTPKTLVGVSGSVMMNGDEVVEYATYEKPDIPDRFRDDGGSVNKWPTEDETSQIFYQDRSAEVYNALLYKGENFMSAYFAFNFYLISDEADRQECVYKLFTGVGLTGGVTVEPMGSTELTVYPGNTESFQFNVINLGKKEDSMELEVKASFSSNYPTSTKYRNWDPYFMVDGSKMANPAVTLGDKASSNDVYLYVTAPAADKFSDYPDAGEKVTFRVTAISTNTKLDNLTYVFTVVPKLGNITMECLNPEKEIEVNDEAVYLLRLYNDTNADDDVDVRLSYDGDGEGLAKFFKKGSEITTSTVPVTLEPNDDNQDVELHIISNEHTYADWHNVTAYLKNDDQSETYASVLLSTEVKQFYRVACNTTGDAEKGLKNFTIDPNEYVDEENITKTFNINVRNSGNGIDTIGLKAEWSEYPLSEEIDEWAEPQIYVKADKPISSINVDRYDEIKKRYGEQQVKLDVFLPIDMVEGVYVMDFEIESSQKDDDVDGIQNNKVSFMFEIIKPNLLFTKLNNMSEPNFEFKDIDNDEMIEEDDFGEYYVEKEHKEFSSLEFEIKVYVDNNGDSEIEIERNDVWLLIWHFDEDDEQVDDANLTPTSPTSAVLAIGGSEEFTFYWQPLDQEQNTEYQYTFEIIIDGLNNVYETNENDNTGEFDLIIKHKKKPKSSGGGGGGMPGFESALVFAAIAIVLLGLIATNRRRRY